MLRAYEGSSMYLYAIIILHFFLSLKLTSEVQAGDSRRLRSVVACAYLTLKLWRGMIVGHIGTSLKRRHYC